jgi:chromosome segregation ATPase
MRRSPDRGSRQMLNIKALFTTFGTCCCKLTDYKGPAMANIQPEWIRHQSDIGESSSPELSDDVLSFRRDPANLSKERDAAAIEMVYQAASLIKEIEHRAADTDMRAQALVACAFEKLELAERRMYAADEELHTIQASIDEANLRLHEIEGALGDAESCIVSTEANLAAAEQRADAAEMRADEARAALVRIENAIRTHLLGLDRVASRTLAAAA